MRTETRSNALVVSAALAALLAGCYPITPPGPAPTGPGSLTLRVDWANNCTTCSSVTIPKHCWSGNVTAASGTTGGDTSFASKCMESTVVSGNPVPIQATTSVLKLQAGQWSVHVDTQDGRSVTCPATVTAAGTGLTWVETDNRCGKL